jgi:hypothetical protein
MQGGSTKALHFPHQVKTCVLVILVEKFSPLLRCNPSSHEGICEAQGRAERDQDIHIPNSSPQVAELAEGCWPFRKTALSDRPSSALLDVAEKASF